MKFLSDLLKKIFHVLEKVMDLFLRQFKAEWDHLFMTGAIMDLDRI